MESDLLFPVVAGICILLIVTSGLIMRQMGKPYGGVVFTLHKLSVLAAIIFTWISLVKLAGEPGITGNAWLMLVITIITGIISFVTGALQSFEKPAPVFVIVIHKISSYLVIISSIITFILIN